MSRSFFALVLVVACSRSEKLTTTPATQSSNVGVAAGAPVPSSAGAPTPKQAAPATPAAERERAERLFNETVDRHGSYVAMAKNASSQRSTMRRYELGLEVFQASVRCPAEPDPAGVERSLRILSARLSLPIGSLRVAVQPPQRRELPKEVPDGTRIEVDDNDVRGILRVSLLLGAAPTGELLKKIASETITLPRLIVWTSAQQAVADGGATAVRLEGEAYWLFADVAVPNVVHRPPTFADALERSGLAAAPNDPAAKEHVEKARKLFDEIAANRSDYEQVLGLVRQSVVVGRRFRFVRDRRARQDAGQDHLKLSSVP